MTSFFCLWRFKLFWHIIRYDVWGIKKSKRPNFIQILWWRENKVLTVLWFIGTKSTSFKNIYIQKKRHSCMTTGVFIQTNVSNILKEFTSIFHQRNPVNRIAYLVLTCQGCQLIWSHLEPTRYNITKIMFGYVVFNLLHQILVKTIFFVIVSRALCL